MGKEEKEEPLVMHNRLILHGIHDAAEQYRDCINQAQRHLDAYWRLRKKLDERKLKGGITSKKLQDVGLIHSLPTEVGKQNPYQG